MSKKLYKFQGTDDFRLKSIENNSVWLSYPEVFNDVYDCNVELMNDLQGDDVRSDAGHHIDDIKALIKKNFSGGVNANYTAALISQEMIAAALHWANNEEDSEAVIQSLEDGIRKLGVLCLMSRHSSSLMWAYYANGLTGFCAEYESSNIQIQPMSYSSSRAQEYFSDFLLNPRVSINRIINTKTLEWAHEDEHRLVMPRPDNIESTSAPGFCICEKAAQLKLTKIIGGAKISPDDKEKLTILAKNRDVQYSDYQNNDEYL